MNIYGVAVPSPGGVTPTYINPMAGQMPYIPQQPTMMMPMMSHPIPTANGATDFAAYHTRPQPPATPPADLLEQMIQTRADNIALKKQLEFEQATQEARERRRKELEEDKKNEIVQMMKDYNALKEQVVAERNREREERESAQSTPRCMDDYESMLIGANAFGQSGRDQTGRREVNVYTIAYTTDGRNETEETTSH